MRTCALLLTVLLCALAMPTSAQSLTPGVEVQETSPLISYSASGLWAPVADASARGGGYYAGQATTSAPVATFRFYGDSFILYYVTSSVGQNDAFVRVINRDTSAQSDTPINFYSASVGYSYMLFANLAIANYQVEVTGSCCAFYISLDAVYVATPAVPTPLPTLTPVPTATPGPEATIEVSVVIEQTPELWRDEILLIAGDQQRPAAIDYRIDAGQVAILTLLAMVVVLLAIGVVKMVMS